MFSRLVAILLAVGGLYLSGSPAVAQPRAYGGREMGRAFSPRNWGGGGRFGGRGAAFGGFGAPGYGRGFGGPPAGYGRRFSEPSGGYGGYAPGFDARGYAAPAPAYGAGGRGAPGLGWRSEQDEVRRAVRDGRQIPLGQAIEAVRRRAPGRELDAGLEAGPNGRPVYRLRWAGQDGRRQDYMVDAGTGAVLGVQGGP